MTGKKKRVSFTLPVSLTREIDAFIEPREKSSFIAVAAQLEICRRRAAASRFEPEETLEPEKPQKQIYVN